MVDQLSMLQSFFETPSIKGKRINKIPIFHCTFHSLNYIIQEKRKQNETHCLDLCCNHRVPISFSCSVFDTWTNKDIPFNWGYRLLSEP